jgi:hypothetical protein
MAENEGIILTDFSKNSPFKVQNATISLEQRCLCPASGGILLHKKFGAGGSFFMFFYLTICCMMLHLSTMFTSCLFSNNLQLY